MCFLVRLAWVGIDQDDGQQASLSAIPSVFSQALLLSPAIGVHDASGSRDHLPNSIEGIGDGKWRVSCSDLEIRHRRLESCRSS